ncbi:MAG TPA: GntR family transcriptional regulator [Solirubrobacterales bacterium]|jgi:DNA-binding transcriptional regulator YhcF (GntR family)|nr:GntR family transcriptional regulator [Solirubrobacterales bacterium]
MAHSSGAEDLSSLVRADDLPIGVNLAWRMQVLIQSGRLGATERLPGVRELAAGAGVNTNTARSVYRRLEGDGLTISRQGLGTFVAPYVPVSPTLEQLAAEVAAEAHAQGIDPRELARALYSGTPPGETFAGSPAQDPGAGSPAAEQARLARASLRGQIARLEASLAPYPDAAAPERAQGRLGPRPHLIGLGELEAIRDGLVARLERARADAGRRAESETFAAMRREGSREGKSGDWEPGAALGPVGALMRWWRTKIYAGRP